MTPRDVRWKVVLIVEDDTDGKAIRQLVRSSAPAGVVVDWLPAQGIGNIKRRGRKLIELAVSRLEGRGGCVAVVVDRDGRNPSQSEPHRSIARACKQSRVEFIAAKETLEAWLLADRGVSEWLGFSLTTPTDRIANPRRVVERAFLKLTGRPYQQRRARMELARRCSGLDPSRNSSASEALLLLRQCVDEVDGGTR